MGIDNATAIVVGVRRDQLSPEIIEMIHDGDIEVFAPHYDGWDEPHAICGIRVLRAYDSKEIDMDKLQLDIQTAKRDFTLQTGMKGKLYLTLDIS